LGTSYEEGQHSDADAELGYSSQDAWWLSGADVPTTYSGPVVYKEDGLEGLGQEDDGLGQAGDAPMTVWAYEVGDAEGALPAFLQHGLSAAALAM
jgi:hypothetical protein